MTTYKNILSKQHFEVPPGWQAIETIDMHTGGEPLRVILSGLPELAGNNVLEYRRFVKDNYDHLRTALMFEPRGHADMYGCILLPPNDDDGDFGILFLHNEGYSTMCGHATIAIASLAAELGWIKVEEGLNEMKIDAPCGRVTAFVHVERGKVSGASFHNVPSFVVGLDRAVEVPGYGKINYDLAYGGAFYAYVTANQIGLQLTDENYREIIKAGMAIKHAVMTTDKEILHPFEADLSFLYGTIFIGGPVTEGIDSRNVCIFAEGEVDRSPTGSGVAGRMAIHHARREMQIGQKMTIESIVGSVFKGSIVEEVDFGPFKAVIPRVEGTAHITGRHTFIIDPNDPMKNGFFLR